MEILKEFEKNDAELEDIADKICGELDKLKATTENITTQEVVVLLR